MKILHIYKDYFPVVGGIENHIRILAEGQAARGHSVTVLVVGQDHRSHVEEVNGVRVISTSRLFTLSSAPLSIDLYSQAARIDSDVAHLHAPYPIGEMAAYLFGRFKALVLTYHSDIVRQRVAGAIYTPLLHRVLARAQCIIATSPNYIALSPVLRRWREKCAVVPLGIPDLDAPVSINPAGTENLLFVGQLRYYKGLEFLLRALNDIPRAKLVVVGTGPKEREWKDVALQLGVADRVRFVGAVPDADLAMYYAACDIFVLPASEKSEAFGVVQLEAMRAGKPIVSCDVKTGVGWVNHAEVTGLVVPPKDPTALAKAITRLLGDKDLQARMGAAGRSRFLSEFTADRMIEGVLRVYERAR